MSDVNKTPEQAALYRRADRNPNERAAWRAYALAAISRPTMPYGDAAQIADALLAEERERFGEP